MLLLLMFCLPFIAAKEIPTEDIIPFLNDVFKHVEKELGGWKKADNVFYSHTFNIFGILLQLDLHAQDVRILGPKEFKIALSGPQGEFNDSLELVNITTGVLIRNTRVTYGCAHVNFNGSTWETKAVLNNMVSSANVNIQLKKYDKHYMISQGSVEDLKGMYVISAGKPGSFEWYVSTLASPILGVLQYFHIIPSETLEALSSEFLPDLEAEYTQAIESYIGPAPFPY